MLPCVCSVIDHRRRKNVRTKMWHTKLPHFDVFCDLLLNRRTATWNLFFIYIITKQATTDKAFCPFQNLLTYRKSRSLRGLCPLWRTRKKAICLYKIKQSHCLLWVTKNCDWSKKITPLSNLTRVSLLFE